MMARPTDTSTPPPAIIPGAYIDETTRCRDLSAATQANSIDAATLGGLSL